MWIKTQNLTDSFLIQEPILPIIVTQHILLASVVLIYLIDQFLQCQLNLPIMTLTDPLLQLIQVIILIIHTHHTLKNNYYIVTKLLRETSSLNCTSRLSQCCHLNWYRTWNKGIFIFLPHSTNLALKSISRISHNLRRDLRII